MATQDNPTPSFYTVNIDIPLNWSLTKPNWDETVLGRLHAKTKGTVYLDTIQSANSTIKEGLNTKPAQYAWRVVDAYFIEEEDTTMSYFRAYDLNGNFLPQATFGVSYTSVPQRINSGNFNHSLPFGNNYYVPLNNNFMTVETGGYTVQVLDENYPSEGLSFGLFKQDGRHQGMVISFRLYKLDYSAYPNDMPKGATPR